MYRVPATAADERVRAALAACAEGAHLRSTQKRDQGGVWAFLNTGSTSSR